MIIDEYDDANLKSELIEFSPTYKFYFIFS